MANPRKQGEQKKEEKKPGDQQQKPGVSKPKPKPTPYSTILKALGLMDSKSPTISDEVYGLLHKVCQNHKPCSGTPTGDHCVQLIGMQNRITKHDLFHKKKVMPALRKLDVVWRNYSHRHPAEAQQVEEELMELDNQEPEDQPGASNVKDNPSKDKKAKSKKSSAEEDQAK
ncbi:unnamed protein product [Bursaphelenchus xylophilus]|nr:unnamed protein product [Bursaphelenchus xylophilus]CAD5229741.1 unnamed protein product [Bursaphelenchus xylophilus]CAG9120470.1 unnamed protein product [Bursaphelenchus xylophilus]CAG9120474.1 unnamed protein product [Bursaphelenchus xylophilus]